MCGISGIISKTTDKSQSEIEEMNRRIIHRGPDGEGFFEGSNFLFGHRRLSIIDINEGHQPMTYEDRYTIIFNGEIFNYLELKRELASKGYKFKTNSDTEVIMAAYDHWDKDCLSHFNGMWAFALYDKKRRHIFCARDRYAIKPFIYANLKQKFIFGSELKQFLAVEEFSFEANSETSTRFLSKGHLNQGQETLAVGVNELPGGHHLVYDLNSHTFEVQRWYNLEDLQSQRHLSFPEGCEKFQEHFFNSLQLRTRADVQVGALLSGGLDSSSIVCGIHSLHQNIVTLSSCFENPKYDEREYIEAVVEKTGVKNIKSFPNLDNWFSFSELEGFIYSQDQPVTGLSHMAETNIYREVSRAGLKVVLDGQGSDEYLAGYPPFFPMHHGHLLRKLDLGTLIRELGYRKHLYGVSNISSVKEMLRHSIPGPLRSALKLILNWQEAPNWVNLESVGRVKDEWKQKQFSSIFEYSKHQIIKSIPYLVHSADRSSMAHSVESRLPFLDYRLLEFTMGLPDEFKIRNGMTKAVLREGLKNILPQKVYLRTNKMGFVTPEDKFFKENKDLIVDYLKFAVESSNGLINKSIVPAYIEMTNKGQFDRSYFRAIAYGIWLHRFSKA